MRRIATTICALTLVLSVGCGEKALPRPCPPENYSSPKLDDAPCSRTIFVEKAGEYCSKQFIGTSNKTGRKMCEYE
jgi:hypothetical protein